MFVLICELFQFHMCYQ